ncbi:MAG: hypothetical protein JW735_00510 [Prolixibacteraceae bacterium]|nr:hypothetical protein [Prolixibacteraceae bacterium]
MNENNNNAVTCPPFRGLGGVGFRVNAHLHTPYSFSAFESIPQALDMAVAENVKVVGINDFYATEGYAEWDKECAKRNLYPLFNIEFISLNKEDQANGIRVNDPNNPGRTYLSGKGLAYPLILKDPYLSQLNKVKAESNKHVEKMCGKLNEILASIEAPFAISFEEVKQTLTKGSIRERHLAKALRMNVSELFADEAVQAEFYQKVFGGKALKSNVSDVAAVENEIRGNLLKAGGAAFVPESPEAFLDMEDVCKIIIAAGGIPTYPFLADFGNNEFTDFEADKEKTLEILKQRGFASIEFIPTRNTAEVLEDYTNFFWDNGFVVTFGTEHNTPAMEPLEVFVQKNKPLSPRMLEINYQSACVVAAHQHLVKQGLRGYIDENGLADFAKRDEYILLGEKLIKARIL